MKDGHSARAVEEASAWLALLHGPGRTRALEEGFRRWVAANPQHEAAFDAVTAMWDTTAGLAKRPLHSPRRGRFGGVTAVAAAMGTVVLAAIVTAHLLHFGSISTGTGEQRMVTLDDGTRVYLNTDSRIRIAYSTERRGVLLESGEALFDVAQRGPQWPFVVTARTKQVTAMGTSFVVREVDDAVSITLIEGHVSVSSPGPTGEEARAMIPGQRLTFPGRDPPRLDLPKVEHVTAWRQGRVELDDTPLAAAVMEMNRYSTTQQLRIGNAEVGSILIKGAFRAGDVRSFAQSVAITCNLQVVAGTHEILLTGAPSANCR